MKKSRLLGAVCACMFAVLESAFAAPVTIQIEGVLAESVGSGTSDSLDFEGASMRVQYMFDTTDVPGSTSVSPTGVSFSSWRVTTVTVDVTNRPNSKQDLIGVAGVDTGGITPILSTAANYFNPAESSFHDFYSINAARFSTGEPVADPAPFDVNSILLDFGNQNFFSGEAAVADLSFFERLPTDITSLLSGINALTPFVTGVGGSLYDLTNAQVTNTVVPIPAAAWLFGSGLLGLVGIARRKKA